MEKLQVVKGFKDILPDEMPQWKRIESIAAKIFSDYGYREIRTPILEYTELFKRSIGEETDIVEKEMYTFEDPGGRSLTMRPESTAGVVRAYIDNGIYKSSPRFKVFYIGPMFRRERPQKGRFRQFHQIGAEAFGSTSALVDAEQMAMLNSLFTELSVKNLDLAVNSLGCPQCRPAYRDALVLFLKSIPETELCESCIKRRATNPLRALDCKEQKCAKAIEGVPTIFDFLCPACKSHHADLEKFLNLFGVKYKIVPTLVRGLDYYSRTVFEFLSGEIGAQSAVAAGGRYDSLVEQLGGPPIPGVGFAIGIERLAMISNLPALQNTVDVFIATLGEKAVDAGLKIAHKLRQRRMSCEFDYDGKGLKGQMKLADRLGAKFALIIGDSEIQSGKAALQKMSDGKKIEIVIFADDPDKTAAALTSAIEENSGA